MFRFLILGLLRDGVRMHGYALVKAYRERSGAMVGTGNFYRELQRLIRDGLIRGSENPSEMDARRTPYEITARGIAVFDEWFMAQYVVDDAVSEDEISARALFFPTVKPPVAMALLGPLKNAVWFLSKRLERERLRLLAQPDDEERRRSLTVLLLLLARRQQYVAADLELIEALRTACEGWLAADRLEHQSELVEEVGGRGRSSRRTAEARASIASRPAKRSPR